MKNNKHIICSNIELEDLSFVGKKNKHGGENSDSFSMF